MFRKKIPYIIITSTTDSYCSWSFIYTYYKQHTDRMNLAKRPSESTITRDVSIYVPAISNRCQIGVTSQSSKLKKKKKQGIRFNYIFADLPKKMDVLELSFFSDLVEIIM